MQKSKKILIEAIKSRIITPKDDIITLLINGLKIVQIQNGNIVIITSKVISITEGRIVKIKSKNDFDNLVKKEADQIFFPTSKVQLTKKNNIFIPWAGIDRSNIKQGYAVLWPKNPYKTADQICKALKKHFKLKKLGVIISDSFCVPLRRGVSAVAIGYAGFKGVNDLRGEKDLFGNKLKVTQQGIADMLAVSAHLLMGESKESTPFALIKGADSNLNIQFTNKKIDPDEATIKKNDCLYAPLYT